MLDKIKLPNNKLASLHYHELTDNEREFIIFNLDPIKFINSLIEFYNTFNNISLTKYPYIKKEIDTLKSIINKLDIFDKF